MNLFHLPMWAVVVIEVLTIAAGLGVARWMYRKQERKGK